MKFNWTFGELAHWILEHKQGHAFVEYSSTDVLREVVQCAGKGGLLVVNDGANITGVVTYDKRPGTIFVRNVLVSERKALKEMLQWFLRNYQGYALTASRHLKLKQFKNVELITHKL